MSMLTNTTGNTYSLYFFIIVSDKEFVLDRGQIIWSEHLYFPNGVLPSERSRLARRQIVRIRANSRNHVPALLASHIL
jgi:hypothetical protein